MGNQNVGTRESHSGPIENGDKEASPNKLIRATKFKLRVIFGPTDWEREQIKVKDIDKV